MDANSTLNGNYLTHSGEVAFSEINAPVICLYFSAHWCPPCRNFTPVLAKLYNEWNKDNKQIEIIFVSSDNDLKSFKEYFETMPWISLPFQDPKTDTLCDLCDVQGIPMLVVISKEGKVLNADARGLVTKYDEKAIDQLKAFYN